MAILTGISLDWLRGLGRTEHNHNPSGGHTFKAGLWLAAAVLSLDTVSYTATQELTGTGYTAGGVVVAPVVPTVIAGSGTVYDFADASWGPGATWTGAQGIGVYNDTHASNVFVFVLNFGGVIDVTNGTVIIEWPAATFADGIVVL